MLKKSGIDMIVFKGKAAQPVYLWIDAGRAQLRPATHLWVKTPRLRIGAAERNSSGGPGGLYRSGR